MECGNWYNLVAMPKLRLVFFISGFLFVAIIGFFAIQYARGYRFDIKRFSFTPTGILVATSNPDAAQTFINGKLVTATNENLILAPGTVDVEIVKEGYWPWKKRLTIQASVVTKTDALLLPKAPTLAPLTFDGVTKTFISADGTKLVWIVDKNQKEKAGLWLLELVNLPFGFAREARKITDEDLSEAKITWSPNGRELLVEKAKITFLLDLGTTTRQEEIVALSPTRVNQILSSWRVEEEKRQGAKIKNLPQVMQDILKRKAISFSFSPDETRVLYKTNAPATIPNNLIPSIPGSSTQKQERDVKENRTYIYDIKEDQNFLILEDSTDLVIGHATDIENSKKRLTWFPTSRHLTIAEADKITIMEYDGTNKITVWSGSYKAPLAFATPDGRQLIILTTLGATDGNLPNLYTISLK